MFVVRVRVRLQEYVYVCACARACARVYGGGEVREGAPGEGMPTGAEGGGASAMKASACRGALVDP